MGAVGVTLRDLTAPDAPRSLADVHPDHQRAVEQALVRSFEPGSAFAMTYRQRRSDGAYRWTEGRAAPRRDEAGRILQGYGVCGDVHDRSEARRVGKARCRAWSDRWQPSN